MTTRIKLSFPLINSREDAEAMLGELAKSQSALNHSVASMDTEITLIRQRFESTQGALQNDIELKTGLLERWASDNQPEFGKAKSIEMLHGRIGFRTGTPKLKTLAKYTWKAVLLGLKLEKRSELIRTEEEVDKETIISQSRNNLLTEDDLKAFGVKIVQDESFFVEPKLEGGVGK